MSLLDLAAQPENYAVVEPLPHWADKHLNGEYELYAQLATKVGERAGNGLIVFEHEEKIFGGTLKIYGVLTDFGNFMLLNQLQIAEMYHPPKYRMKKALAEFRREFMEIYMQMEPDVLKQSEAKVPDASE